MTEEPQTLSVPNNILTATNATPDASTTLPKPPVSRKPGRLKKFAWRGTATIYWLWRIGRFLFGSDFMTYLTSVMRTRSDAFLSSVGFAPSHSESLPRILQDGWLLAIVGFKPFELLGLLVYVYLAPLTLLGYLVFRGYAKDFEATTVEKRGLRPPRIRRPALTIAGLVLLGWFVLYGGASSRRPLIAGAVLSGCLFFVLAARAFQRVRPAPIGSDSVSLPENIGLSLLKSGPETVKRAKDAKKKSEVVGSLFLFQKAGAIWRCFALIMRGQAGRNRLYLLLLIDYVVSMLLLGAAAILSWGLILKLIYTPSTASLMTFIRITWSYFLPNVNLPATNIDFPIWAQMGCSTTAFILFVLFVGAAASLLPSRYSTYAERLDVRYRMARVVAIGLRSTARALERIKLSKPKSEITHAAS